MSDLNRFMRETNESLTTMAKYCTEDAALSVMLLQQQEQWRISLEQVERIEQKLFWSRVLKVTGVVLVVLGFCLLL